MKNLCILVLTIAYSAPALVLLGCSGSSEPTDPAALAQCYATEFGSPPPAGVQNLKAKQVMVGDAAAAWLRFEADSNVISQIVHNRFIESNQTEFRIYGNPEGGNTPGWWQPNLDALSAFYINKQWRPGSNYSIAVLGYDPTNRLVYFHHGISL